MSINPMSDIASTVTSDATATPDEESTPTGKTPKRTVNKVFIPYRDSGHLTLDPHTHQLTLAVGKVPSYRATKSFTMLPNPITGVKELSVSAYDPKGQDFYMAHLNFSNLQDLYSILQQVQDDPRALILRGEVIDENPNSQRRRKLGDDAEIREVDLALALLDVDSYPRKALDQACPHLAGKSLTEILNHHAAELLEAILHPSLRGCGAVIQVSSSCEMRPTQVLQKDGKITPKTLPSEEVIRLHIWILLDRAVAARSLKEWVVWMNFHYPEEMRFKKGVESTKIAYWTSPEVIAKVIAREPIMERRHGQEVPKPLPLDIGGRFDQALFNASQPHYVAKPIFGEGVSDPFPRRIFLCQGPPASIPSWVLTGAEVEALEAQEAQARKDRTRAREEALEAQRRTYTRAASITGGDTWWASLLALIDADTRPVGLSVAAALQRILGKTEGWDVYLAWCKVSPLYQDDTWAKQIWQSASPCQDDDHAVNILAKCARDSNPEDPSCIDALQKSGLQAARAGNTRDSLIIEFDEGGIRYHFDLSGLCYSVCLDAESEKYLRRSYFAQNLIPLAAIKRCALNASEGSRHEIQVKFKTLDGYETTEISKGSSYTSKGISEAASLLGGKGCDLFQKGNVEACMEALDAWHRSLSSYRYASSAPIKSLVKSPGWIGSNFQTFANGTTFFGEGAERYELATDQKKDKVSHSHAKLRGKTKGSLQDWLTACQDVYDTPGLITLLGVSLAGSLVQPLGLMSWGAHLYSLGEKGKTTSMCVAQSVWGPASNTSVDGLKETLLGSWSLTPTAIERRAMAASGSLLTLDDLGQSAISHTPEILIQLLMQLSSGSGKERSHDAWEQMSWDVTLLSSGEKSLADYAQGQAMTGLITRYMDLRYDPESGEWTKDATHGDLCKATSQAVYGIAGNEWISYLLQPGKLARAKTVYATFQKWYTEQLSAKGEATARMSSYAAAILTSLQLASEGGILPYSREKLQEVAKFLRDQIKLREVKSQEELAWGKILTKINTTHSIDSKTLRDDKKRPYYAVRDTNWENDSRTALYVSGDTITNAISDLKLATSEKSLLTWARRMGRLTDSRRVRVGGIQHRWSMIIDSEDEDGVGEDLPPLCGIPNVEDLPRLGEPDPDPSPEAPVEASNPSELEAPAQTPAQTLEAPVEAPKTPSEEVDDAPYTIPDILYALKDKDMEIGKYDLLENRIRQTQSLGTKTEGPIRIFTVAPEQAVKGTKPLVLRDPLGVCVILNSSWESDEITKGWFEEQGLTRLVRGTHEERLASLLEGLL